MPESNVTMDYLRALLPDVRAYIEQENMGRMFSQESPVNILDIMYVYRLSETEARALYVLLRDTNDTVPW